MVWRRCAFSVVIATLAQGLSAQGPGVERASEQPPVLALITHVDAPPGVPTDGVPATGTVRWLSSAELRTLATQAPTVEDNVSSLTIVPTFDSTITSDSNAVAIENAINTAIAAYSARFTTPITVNIKFQKGGGLGSSNTPFCNLSYATYLSALKASAASSDDSTAYSLLPNLSTNPVTGASTMNVKTANGRALAMSAFTSGGCVTSSDGTISLNTAITTPGNGAGTTAEYDLISVAEHEIDEVLGLSSALPSPPFGTIFPQDLFRYDGSAGRSFTTATATSYFSIDGTNRIVQFHNQNDGADYGDWETGVAPAQVQDAFATRFATPRLGPSEIRSLDVIGYTVAPTVPLAPTGLTALFAGDRVNLSWNASSGATGYKVKRGTSSGAETTLVIGVPGTAFSDTTVTGGGWFYVVSALGAGGESGNSNEVSVMVTVPAAPTGLTARRAGDRINLSWTGSAFAATYNVKRGTCFGCETLLAAGIAGTGYSDTSIVSGQRYFYVVSAVSRIGESANSSEAVVGFLRSGDFDGDKTSDLTVFRPSTGFWFTLRSSSRYATYSSVQWGLSTDTLVPADYDGDGIIDNAVFRPSTNTWFILYSSTGNTTYTSMTFGASGDIPVPGDYDGDGKADVAVFRPSNTTWYIWKSSDNGVIVKTFGLSTDVLVPADYDGDGRTDIAVFRPSNTTWFILTSSTDYQGAMIQQFGLSTDVLVPGDYDGDGRTDIAVFRPSSNTWFASLSGGGVLIRTFGASGDIVIPGDYDGDGATDVAVFRPSTGTWYVWKSSDNGVIVQPWGLGTDLPVNKRP